MNNPTSLEGFAILLLVITFMVVVVWSVYAQINGVEPQVIALNLAFFELIASRISKLIKK